MYFVIFQDLIDCGKTLSKYVNDDTNDNNIND